jgi:hypothetical protein
MGGWLKKTLSKIDPFKSISNAFAKLDDAVNSAIPGGWATVAAVVITVMSGGTVNLEGETTVLEGAAAIEGGAVAGEGALTAAELAEYEAAIEAADAATTLTAEATEFTTRAFVQGAMDLGVPFEIATALPQAGISSLISGVNAAINGKDPLKAMVQGGVWSLVGGSLVNEFTSAGMPEAMARIAAQASTQALRTGKINIEALAASAALGQIDPKVADVLNKAGVPSALMPTMLGAFNQALLTGNVRPDVLAAQATGQVFNSAWNSIKSDYADTKTKAPVEDIDPTAQQYLVTQEQFDAAQKELMGKIDSFNKNIEEYKGAKSEFDETFKPLYDKSADLKQQYDVSKDFFDNYGAKQTEYDQKVEEYNREKTEFETPVRSSDSEGSGPTQGLHIIEGGDDDHPTVYGDERGAAFIISRNGEGDTYMRRIDSAFPKDPPPALLSKAEVQSKGIDLAKQLNSVNTQINQLAADKQPLIDKLNTLSSSIPKDRTTIEDLQYSLTTPKDGNLADQLKTASDKINSGYTDFLSTIDKQQTETEQKALAEIERLAKEQQEKQTLADVVKTPETTQPTETPVDKLPKTYEELIAKRNDDAAAGKPSLDVLDPWVIRDDGTYISDPAEVKDAYEKWAAKNQPIKIEGGPEDIKLVPEPVVPDSTLTPEQQWAKNHGVLNADGTIDWTSYDIDSGVGTGSTGPEQTEEEVRAQLGTYFDLVYPNGYPGKDVAELPEVKATFDDEEPDNWDPALMGDWSTFNKPEPPDNWDPALMGDWSKLNPEERSTAVGGTKGTGGGGIKTPTVKPPTPPVTPPVKPPVTPTVTPTAPVAPVAAAAAAAASPFMTVSDLNKPVDIKYYTDMASQGILPQQPETNAAQFKLEKDRAEKEKEAENNGEGDFAYGGLINGYDDEFTIEDLLNMLRS